MERAQGKNIILTDKKTKAVVSNQIWMLLAALIVAVSAIPFTSGLSFVESVTAFVVGEGTAPALRRSTEFLTASPLYYASLAAMRDILTSLALGSEFTLRLPSLIATALLCAVFYHLVRVFSSPVGGLMALTILAFNPQLLQLLCAAQPAVFSVLFALAALAIWVLVLKRRSALNLSLHLLLTVLSIYSDYQILLPLFSTHALLWWIFPTENRLGWRRALFYLSLVTVICSPGLMHCIELAGRPEFKSDFKDFSTDAAWRFAVTYSSVFIVLGYGLSQRLNLQIAPNLNVDRNTLSLAKIGFYLGVTWWLSALLSALLPGLLHNAIFPIDSQQTAISFLGLALALGIFASQFLTKKTPTLLAAVSIAITVFYPAQSERWRETAQVLNLKKNTDSDSSLSSLSSVSSRSQLFILSGLPEAEHVQFYERKDAGKYLAAPFLFYPVSQHVIPAGYSNLTQSIGSDSQSGIIVYRGAIPALPTDLFVTSAVTEAISSVPGSIPGMLKFSSLPR